MDDRYIELIDYNQWRNDYEPPFEDEAEDDDSELSPAPSDASPAQQEAP